MTEQAITQRLRVVFGKLGAQKYIGHLDLAKTWERILRRAGVSLAYSQGFNARPKIQIAAPLPLGITSECEIMDVWLERPLPLEGLAERLMEVSPPGLPIHSIEEVPPRAPALQTLLESAVYRITPRETIDAAQLRSRVTDLLAQPRVMRVRRDKPYDLRPLIYDLRVEDAGFLVAELALSDQGTARTDELIDALGLAGVTMAVHRVKIVLRANRE